MNVVLMSNDTAENIAHGEHRYWLGDFFHVVKAYAATSSGPMLNRFLRARMSPASAADAISCIC
jgi:hypothetical protein